MDIVLLMITLSISTYLITSIYHSHRKQEILPHLIELCFLWQTIGILVAYAFYYKDLQVMLHYPQWLNFFFVMVMGISLYAFLSFLFRHGFSKKTLYNTLGLSCAMLLVFYLVHTSTVSLQVVLFANIFVYSVSLVILYRNRDPRQSFLSFAQIAVGIIAFSLAAALKGIITPAYTISIANGSIFIIALGAMMYYLEHTTYRMADINQSLVDERDISEDLRKKYEMVLENVHEGIWEYDLVDNRAFLSDVLRDFFGVSTKYLEGAFEVLVKHFHPEDLRSLADQISGTTHEALVYSMMRGSPSAAGKEYRIFSHVENRYVWVNLKATRVIDPKTFRIHLYGTMSVIQNARDAEERIYQLAYYDQLTGLRNATSFYEELEQLRKNDATQRVLFLVDLDRFKYINDSRGHSFGNAVIRNIARNLVPLHQFECEAYRFGGTEFLLTAPLEYLAEISIHLSHLFGTAMDINGSSIHLTASIGYCPIGPETLTTEKLMIQLDLAKNKAKEMGGNCQVGYSESFNEELQKKVTLSDALRKALLDRDLYMHYQPKICLKTGDTVGYEALLRWNLEGSHVPPDQIIEIAEETGQIHALGRLIIDMVFQESTFAEAHQTIAINLSVMQLEQNGFLEDVEVLQRLHGVQPARFIFEITESVLMQGMESAVKTLYTLQEKGYRISLDDFGTGYASYNYLSRLPINELKLDKSLTQSVLDSEKDKAIVRHMVEIGKLLNFTVVCEGVENLEEYEALKSYGCDLGQGYYFSVPLPSSRFIKAAETQ